MNFRAVVLTSILGLCSLLIQGTVLKSISPETLIVPNLMVIVVAFLAFYELSPFGGILSFILGLLFDLASGSLLGPWAGAFVVVYALLCSFSQRVFVESPVTAFIAVFSGALVAQIVYITLLLQFRPGDLVPVAFTVRILIEAFMSALCAPLLFKLLRTLKLVRSNRAV